MTDSVTSTNAQPLTRSTTMAESMTDLTIHPRDFNDIEGLIEGNTDAGRRFLGNLAGGDIPAVSISVRASQVGRIAEMAVDAGLTINNS